MHVLHASPHPDDELIGAPATLMALRDAGHTIVNLACSFGRPADQERRRAELAEASHRAGFASEEADQLLPSSRAPLAERREAEERLAKEIAERLGDEAFELVVGPSPHDRHPGHESVGRSVRTALEGLARPVPWWMWQLWGDLPFRTLLVTFGEERLREILTALEAHAGEIARNDYRDLVAGRALVSRVLGAELVFGFGGEGVAGPYAETTCEAVRAGGHWLLGAARELDPAVPFADPSGTRLDAWLQADSASQRVLG